MGEADAVYGHIKKMFPHPKITLKVDVDKNIAAGFNRGSFSASISKYGDLSNFFLQPNIFINYLEISQNAPDPA